MKPAWGGDSPSMHSNIWLVSVQVANLFDKVMQSVSDFIESSVFFKKNYIAFDDVPQTWVRIVVLLLLPFPNYLIQLY